jgi:hypothetical protein
MPGVDAIALLRERDISKEVALYKQQWSVDPRSHHAVSHARRSSSRIALFCVPGVMLLCCFGFICSQANIVSADCAWLIVHFFDSSRVACLLQGKQLNCSRWFRIRRRYSRKIAAEPAAEMKQPEVQPPVTIALTGSTGATIIDIGREVRHLLYLSHARSVF